MLKSLTTENTEITEEEISRELPGRPTESCEKGDKHVLLVILSILSIDVSKAFQLLTFNFQLLTEVRTFNS